MKGVFLTIILGTVVLIYACSDDDPGTIINPPVTVPSDTVGLHLQFGTPEDGDPSDDYLLKRSQFVISYNKNRNVANWVSWNLNAQWFGDEPRFSGSFIRDTLLPDGWYRVNHSDYTNTGFNRGHMVRSEERTRNALDNRTTFFMTNVLPQTPDLNQGVWLDFEYWCEDMCKEQGMELYIIAGGIFHPPHDMLKGVVAVPDSCFKIVVMMNHGERLGDATAQTSVIAVSMPNIDGIRSHDWEMYTTTVDAIELATGYDFLDLLPDGIEDALEAQRHPI
ncbi:MAG: nuclease [Ectothiorhodospiraceae bacterium]|nr:nuclease [Ectothiorhodospiraceae bacterium]